MKKIIIVASLMMLGTSSIWAAGTESNTPITNNASLSYTVGGGSTTYTTDTATLGTGDSFVVDRKIDMVLVTTDTDQTHVAPSQEDMETQYSFKNEGNHNQHFKFEVSNLANGEKADYDDDSDNKQVREDAGHEMVIEYNDGTNGWQVLPANGFLTVPQDATYTFRVKADIPDSSTVEDEDIMNIELKATAYNDNEDAAEEESTTETANVEDVVLADGVNHTTLGDNDNSANGGAHSNNPDTEKDGIELARSGYVVFVPKLSISKTSCVINDPVNGDGTVAGTHTPKRIPGATIRYMITLENTGSDSASNVTIKDTLDSSYVDGTNIQIANVKKVESTNSCDCTSPGTDDADHSESGMETTITGINVSATANETKSCVSFEVEVN